MSTHAAGFAGAAGRARTGNRHTPRGVGPRTPWERCAPWVAPLLTAGLLALSTFIMFANGAPVI
jgi:hypothetical protein